MVKIQDKDFFKREQTQPQQPCVKPAASAVNLVGRISSRLGLAAKFLAENGLLPLAREVGNIEKAATRDHFTVAVVGEFSRGKSAMINRLFGRQFLPEGNLPTTATMVRIRYSQTDRLVPVGPHGKPQQPRPLDEASWNGLTAGGSEETAYDGFVAVGLADKWLLDNNVEIVDTPGAGDLDKGRMRQIGDMLMRCDGAVIAVKADQLLSESERLFIQQRVVGRQTPFVMLVINKLDTVRLEERNAVVDYCLQKLKNWNIDVPVFIGNDVELPDDKYRRIAGIDKVRAEIERWSRDGRRQNLTEQWAAARLAEILAMARQSFADQLAIIGKDEEQRRMAIDEKQTALKRMALEWGNLEIALMQRSNECYSQFCDKVGECANDIVERLQYEAGHAANLQKWWKEDYPYRLKKELANLAVVLNNVVVQRARQDAVWYNAALDKNFKEAISVGDMTIAQRKDMESYTTSMQLDVEDLGKKMNAMRIGTAAVSIAGAMLLTLSGLGILTLVATLGVGTGATILTGNIFKRKTEEQREELKKAIAADVPKVLQRATADSEHRVKAIYDDMRLEAKKKQIAWTETQRQILEQAVKPVDENRRQQLEANIEKTEELIQTIQNNHEQQL